MDSNKIWLVIPAYNEEKYISSVLTKVSKITKNFVVVDDGSSDKTAKFAKRFCDEVLVHDLNLGKGAAMKTGCDYVFDHLGGLGVIFIDSDDQHDPQEVNLFLKEFESGANVIFGERSMDHSMPLIRIMGNRLASVLVAILFGTYIPDIPSGFKALSKKAYKKVRWNDDGYGVELEIAARVSKNKLSFRVVPISTIYLDFERGMNIIDTLKVFAKLINLRLTI